MNCGHIYLYQLAAAVLLLGPFQRKDCHARDDSALSVDQQMLPVLVHCHMASAPCVSGLLLHYSGFVGEKLDGSAGGESPLAQAVEKYSDR